MIEERNLLINHIKSKGHKTIDIQRTHIETIDGCINNNTDLVAVQEHRWQTQKLISTHLEYIDNLAL